jgi:hypothetical protein
VPRASMRVRHKAEGQYPVRLRIAVPPQGLGRQLEIIHGWLDETCGIAGWATAPAGLAGVVNDAIAFYFRDPSFAHAFVARFCCGCRIESSESAFAIRSNAPPARRDARVHKTF